ncbi:MAG: pentapeptide repeat-containing protein [Gomphosphaeria aponina SAG 52.96 = DSM 107014]|uniref:Serine/threonine-protein kinase B n=1 Tax=Gomphosphaeria aponina SAG 52.96 = DSM 107014 TaxID=1521640 RepID=A0A941GMK0_9CHRO|nr:pentapeptide repeat-containing protein [Gomphosphaeria aponina SAG 52.96 = DSM 107014]
MVKIYSYCLNPSCPQPKNDPRAKLCSACGSNLVLHKRFRVVKTLGKGGFGATFIALDITLPGTPVCVVKQLRPMTDDPGIFQMARDLFEREAQTLGKVGNHPQVPRLLDYFEEDKQFYLVQEYIGGSDLQKEVKKNGPLSEEGVRQFLNEVLQILQYIHSMKVIHRDIKPANIIRRDQDKKLVLIDFGAVKTQVNTMAAKNSDQTALTQFSVGTPGFAPAEQLAMRPVYASDIYALGATCLYLLTGKSPRELETDHATGELAWEKYVQINPNFAAVLRKMLEVSVRNRYKSADEVIKALDVAPYEDILKEGLLTQRNTERQGNKIGNLPNSNILSAGNSQLKTQQSSATKNLAEMLKNRKDRQQLTGSQSNNTAINNPRTTLQNKDTTRLQAGGKPVKKAKPSLKEVDVIRGYIKDARRNFEEHNLSNLNLKKAQLSDCVFRQSQLYKTDLQEANLSNCNFYSADLGKALLRKANLSKAYLYKTNLKEADMRGADLRNANLENADLKGANLCGANLCGATVTKEQLKEAQTNWSTILPNGKRQLKLF